jgi:hypothetical protein
VDGVEPGPVGQGERQLALEAAPAEARPASQARRGAQRVFERAPEATP